MRASHNRRYRRSAARGVRRVTRFVCPETSKLNNLLTLAYSSTDN